MIATFAGVRGPVRRSECLDLNHTSKPMIPVSLVIAKLARGAGAEVGELRNRDTSSGAVNLSLALLPAHVRAFVQAGRSARAPGIFAAIAMCVFRASYRCGARARRIDRELLLAGVAKS